MQFDYDIILCKINNLSKLTQQETEKVPFTYEIDRSKDLTIFTGTGNVTLEELTLKVEECSEAGYTRFEIYDFRKAKGDDFTFEKILELVGFTKSYSFPPGNKIAMVVAHMTDHNRARIYKGMAEIEGLPGEVQLFQSLDDAYEWLDIPQEGPGE